MRFALLLSVWLLCSGRGVAQTIRYVTTSGTNANPATATSWANSTPDLQGAIDASTPGDQVWVAGGLYKPTTTTGPDSRTVSFTLREGVQIYGGFTGNETILGQRPLVSSNAASPSSSTLSGDIGTVDDDTDNSYHVVSALTALSANTLLDGFVIAGGNANGNGGYQSNGGGLLLQISSPTSLTSNPTIQYCVFASNKAGVGGGVALFAFGLVTMTPTFTECQFVGNTASSMGAIAVSSAAGSICKPTVRHSTFEKNTAINDGAVTGVTASSSTTSSRFERCSFRQNTANQGGVLTVQPGTRTGGGTTTFVNCEFVGNQAAQGGVVYMPNGTVVGSATLVNCSLSGNQATVRGNLFCMGAASSPYQYGGTLDLTNSIAWNNGGSSAIYNYRSTVNVRYSLIESGMASFSNMGGNLTATTSPFASDISLQLGPCSAAINAADVASYTAVNGPAVDLAGTSRFRGNMLDMGAYQASLSNTNSMVSRQNGDWNDPATWSCGNRLPLLGETVGIHHTVTLPSNYAGTLHSIRYGPNGVVSYASGSQLSIRP